MALINSVLLLLRPFCSCTRYANQKRSSQGAPCSAFTLETVLQYHPDATERIATLRFAQRRKIALKKKLRAAESCAVQIIWIVLIPRLGSEVTCTRSRKRVENWFSNFNAISLALGAVSFKRGHVLEGGQVPADVCARQPICFRMLPKSRADAESGLSRLAIELKRGLFGILMQTNS